MSQKSKTLVVLGALVVIGATLIGVSVANDNANRTAQTAQTTQTQQKKQDDLISYQGQEGKTALDILKSSYNVETKTYDGIGEMVTSINGVAPDEKHFWAFYVNGQQAQVGAGQYTTKQGDKISWKLDAIQ